MTFSMKTVPDGVQITWGAMQINLDRDSRCIQITHSRYHRPIICQIVPLHGSPACDLAPPEVVADVIVSSDSIDAELVRKVRNGE